MHQRPIVILGVLLIAASAVAQDRLETFPGYEGFNEVRRAGRLVTGGTVSEVRWAADAVLFDRGGSTWRYGMDDGVLRAADEHELEGAQPSVTGSQGPRRARAPGRGRQRGEERSPDGAWTAACREWNVVIEPDEGEAISVTTDGDRKLRYGTASWVYGEELDQSTALWWSPDSTMLAFYEFDERDVPDFYITTGHTDRRTDLHIEGYPKPGDPNPVPSLLVYHLESGETVRIDGTGGLEYLYAVRWSPDGAGLLFHRTNRHQNHLELVMADPRTAEQRVIVEETQASWQKNRPTLRFLQDGERFIWETERTGWRQYELRHLDGRRLATLSEGEFPAESIVLVDEDEGWFYYTAYDDHPLNAHLHRVRLDGSECRRLTFDALNHSAFRISPDHRWFVAQRENVETPPSTGLYDMDGHCYAVVAESDTTRMEEAGLSPAELFSFTAADGETTLYGVLWKPADFDPDRVYPLVVDVYGGPLSRGVRNSFRAPNAYCEFGFLVAHMENRGTVGRGKAFEAASYLELGVVDLDDQVAGVRALAERPYVDGGRVGITGHSYGGYMSALAIMRYPDVFRAAVAGAPVTDWRNYDTIYTERFMRTPEENADGYDAGSCLTYVDQYRGGLLLMHGMVDDNVHPTNSWQLVNALQRANKPFDMMFYPNSGHGLGPGSSQIKWEFLHDHLIGPADVSADPGG